MTIKSAVKRFLDWTILLLWLVVGCVIVLFTANMQKPAVGPVLMLFVGIGPIAACLIALRHRKRAAWILLIDGVFAACVLIFIDLLEWINEDHHVSGLLAIFGFIAVFYIFPGAYWLITARRQWPPYLEHSFSGWTKLIFGFWGFLLLFTGSALMGIYQVLYYGDCSPRLFASPKSSDHSVYMAKIIYVHNSSSFANFAGIVAWFPWSIARTEHKYWGLYGWNQTFTILPYRNFNVGEEYLIEGRMRPSLIGHLLNLMDTYCSRTAPVRESALEMHLLQTAPTNDGARIIGQVMKEEHAGQREPVPHFLVTLILDHGSEVVGLTDAKGIFDFPKMPSGHYDVYLPSLPVSAGVEKGRDCSILLTKGEMAECTLVIPASSLSR